MLHYKNDWPAFYFDGQTPQRQKVKIRLYTSSLVIVKDDGSQIKWDYGSIRQTQGFYAGETIRLERGEDITEALVIEEPDFLSALRSVAPGISQKIDSPSLRKLRPSLMFVSGIGVIVFVAIVYLGFIPAFTSWAAYRVPAKWEKGLGEKIVSDLVPDSKKCEDKKVRNTVNRIRDALVKNLPQSPYEFKVMVVQDPLVNAFALPGGIILVYAGLMEQTKTPEELAGVLAHEVQHIERRHTTKRILQHSSMRFLLAAATGKAESLAQLGFDAAYLLGAMRYSRAQEQEADILGLKLLSKSGFPPRAYISFLKSMQKEDDSLPSYFKYLLTHPRISERVRKLEEIVSLYPAETQTKVNSGAEWKKLKKACHAVK